MKVGFNKISNNLKVSFAQNEEHINTAAPIKQGPVCESQNCLEQLGKAQVIMQNQKTAPRVQTEEEIEDVVSKIAQREGMEIGFFITSDLAIRIGRAIEGFMKLHYDDAVARCIKDENGAVKEIFFKNENNRSISVFDNQGNLKKYFSPQETEALHEYKYCPNSFHDFLRYGKKSYMPTQDELNNYIKLIDGIFNDEKRIWKTEKPTIVYRALQDKLTDEQKENLSRVGGILKDTSYVSTTQKIETADRFKHKNPILEIELPANSKYIDLDNLFNIGAKSWREQEFLLNRNSEFVVTGFDDVNKIIKVRYLNKD